MQRRRTRRLWDKDAYRREGGRDDWALNGREMDKEVKTKTDLSDKEGEEFEWKMCKKGTKRGEWIKRREKKKN